MTNDTDDIVISFDKILEIWKSFKKPLIKTFIACFLVTIAILSVFMPVRYLAEAKFLEAEEESSGVDNFFKKWGFSSLANATNKNNIPIMLSDQSLQKLVHSLNLQASISNKGKIYRTFTNIKENLFLEKTLLS